MFKRTSARGTTCFSRRLIFLKARFADFDTSGRLFVTQHGRDQLHEDWPELYTTEQGFELPAEEVMIVKDGAWYGWPNCYFDPTQKKLVLAPEYGGDGCKLVASRALYTFKIRDRLFGCPISALKSCARSSRAVNPTR